MDDRPLDRTRALQLATLALQAFAVLHLFGVISFGGPAVSMALFFLGAVPFYYLRREEERFNPPPALNAVEPVVIRPRMARAVLIVSVVVGFVMAALLPRLMSGAEQADVVRYSALLTVVAGAGFVLVLRHLATPPS